MLRGNEAPYNLFRAASYYQTGEGIMKIVIVIDDLMPGGTEHALLNLLKSKTPDIDAFIITLFPGGNLEQEFNQAGFHIECLHFTPVGFLKAKKKFKALIKQYQPDCAICQRSISRAIFPKIIASMSVPVIMHWDNPNITKPIKTFMLERRQIPHASAYIVSSTIIEEQLKKIYPRIKNITVIHNAVIPQDFFPHNHRDLTNKKIKIISVGSMRNEKRHIEQIRIAEILQKKNIDFQIDIYGDGILKKQIQFEINKRNLNSNVSLHGYVSDIPSVLKKADIFLCTSISEGFSVALLEAMASELACVIYELSFLRDFTESDSFLTVPNGNPQIAAETILMLAENNSLRKQYGEKAKMAVIKNFTADHIFSEWINVFSELI
jgi:glycosyltransferase involved in cell wall biosynthesis